MSITPDDLTPEQLEALRALAPRPVPSLPEALARMDQIAEAPADHNHLTCEALGEAEYAIFSAAAEIPFDTQCPSCSITRALGQAALTLDLIELDDDNIDTVYNVRGDLLDAIRLVAHLSKAGAK